ncbi:MULTISPECIES: hypothetical protein [unclassified Streptomyces]|uniref:hypothetical protein n=1 Tax=unclassified Streptomyces TaxID=2593676 RepID=UPI002E29DB87|nr:hypothetical protein [Streptomyces sp. NBC_00273]
MSDAVACPVFRTPDPALAPSTARSPVEFGRHAYSRVSAYAEFRSVAEVRAVAKELPTGWFRGQEEYGEFDGVPREDRPPLVVGVRGSGLPADPAAYEGRLPPEWELLNVPVGSVEDAFTAAIGAEHRSRAPGPGTALGRTYSSSGSLSSSRSIRHRRVRWRT